MFAGQHYVLALSLHAESLQPGSHVSEWVAGWSIYTEIKLVRDPSLANSQTPYPTLGQLLKQKAEEGVTVLLMVPST